MTGYTGDPMHASQPYLNCFDKDPTISSPEKGPTKRYNLTGSTDSLHAHAESHQDMNVETKIDFVKYPQVAMRIPVNVNQEIKKQGDHLQKYKIGRICEDCGQEMNVAACSKCFKY